MWTKRPTLAAEMWTKRPTIEAEPIDSLGYGLDAWGDSEYGAGIWTLLTISAVNVWNKL